MPVVRRLESIACARAVAASSAGERVPDRGSGSGTPAWRGDENCSAARRATARSRCDDQDAAMRFRVVLGFLTVRPHDCFAAICSPHPGTSPSAAGEREHVADVVEPVAHVVGREIGGALKSTPSRSRTVFVYSARLRRLIVTRRIGGPAGRLGRA